MLAERLRQEAPQPGGLQSRRARLQRRRRCGGRVAGCAVERGRAAPPARPRPIAGPAGTPASSRSAPSIGRRERGAARVEPSPAPLRRAERAGERTGSAGAADRGGDLGRAARPSSSAPPARGACAAARRRSRRGRRLRTPSRSSSAAPSLGAQAPHRERQHQAVAPPPSGSSASAACRPGRRRSGRSRRRSRGRARAAQGRERGDRVGLARRSSRSSLPIRAPLTVSSAPSSSAAVGELERLRLDAEAEPRGVARQAQQARRVVAEARGVQDPQPACREVVQRARDRDAARRAPAPGQPSAIALTVKSRRAQVELERSPGCTSGSAPGRA